MPTYHLFLDESGTREYDDHRDYVNSGKTLYFVYGGILIEERESLLLVARLRELKQLRFGQTDVEIKSNWLRLPHERRTHYLEPLGITDRQLDSFTDDYYELLVRAPIRLIATIVNKGDYI